MDLSATFVAWARTAVPPMPLAETERPTCQGLWHILARQMVRFSSILSVRQQTVLPFRPAHSPVLTGRRRNLSYRIKGLTFSVYRVILPTGYINDMLYDKQDRQP
jgi:hypothetical protein